jgi:stage II sporulation protein D
MEEPHLQRVSDRIPGSDRYYCDVAPRFRWTRTLDGETIDRAMDTYLRRYARSGTGPVGQVRGMRVDGVTASGRVAALVVETADGTFRVRGNDTRWVLRPPNGEILNSTYFSLAPRTENGRVQSVTITGTGYGHGVGMCQWGAIGRARAGQNFREILSTYYPGTTLGSAP